MFLDKTQLLYELFLVLDHALMLDLKLLCEQHSSFIIQIAYKLVELIHFHFFCCKSLCKSCNSLKYSISSSKK